MSELLIEGRAVGKRFGKTLDFSEKLAKKLGATVAEPVVHAVDDVTIGIEKGEVVGLVGESGCGKSTLGRILARLIDASSGEVLFRGEDMASMDAKRSRAARLAVQMIFQNPFASLNPRMRVEDIIGEAPAAQGVVTRRERYDYVTELLRKVGLDPDYRDRYPHQFSGGQRQRIGIARALAVKPELIICDESVAALDVSIQAQILNLFMDLRDELQLAYLFISHDLGVVEHISDRVVIMYLGRVVESAPTEELFANPNHPYTRGLLAEVPRLSNRKRAFATVKGELPSPLNPPSGCHFHPRCPHAMPVCRTERPQYKQVAPSHGSACHLNDQ